MAKMTLEELRKLRDSTKTDLRRRETEGKETYDYLCFLPFGFPPSQIRFG